MCMINAQNVCSALCSRIFWNRTSNWLHSAAEPGSLAAVPSRQHRTSNRRHSAAEPGSLAAVPSRQRSTAQDSVSFQRSVHWSGGPEADQTLISALVRWTRSRPVDIYGSSNYYAIAYRVCIGRAKGLMDVKARTHERIRNDRVWP